MNQFYHELYHIYFKKVVLLLVNNIIRSNYIFVESNKIEIFIQTYCPTHIFKPSQLKQNYLSRKQCIKTLNLNKFKYLQ